MEQEPKEKTKKKIAFYLIPILIFLGFISYMLIRTYTGDVKEAVTETTFSEEGFENLSDTFEEVLQENLYDKNGYINLNGLTTRVLGINSLNEVQKQANGQLSGFGGKSNENDVLECESNVEGLADFLSDRGIEFLYLMLPNKVSFYGADFAPGYSSAKWQNIDFWEEALNEAGIMNIDMDAWYEKNGWTMEDVFFKTDSHWRPEAALAATDVTMEFLSANGLADYNEECLREDSWNKTVLKDWFLGNEGKRTGALYAGVDDITIYEPEFETDYTFLALRRYSKHWYYYDSLLDLSYLDERNYFDDDPYCIYMYGDFPLRMTINDDAWNDQRILIVGDSYKMLYEYFMSTQFHEVFTMDLRYYEEGTLAQYIEEIKPDIVILCTQTTTSMDEFFYFGTEEYLYALDNTERNKAPEDVIDDIVIEAQEDNGNNFIVLFDNLEPGQTYTLTADSTACSGEDDLFVQMTLQDLSDNTVIYNRFFVANDNEPQKWIFTVPEDVDTYAVYLYAGVKGRTKNASAEMANVILHKGVFED